MANFASTDHTRDQLLERPLPHSAEAERAILGAILLDNGIVNQAIELLQTEDFYVGAHRRIFQTMIALSERGSEINPILVGEELRREGYLEQAGGITGVAELTYGLPHFSNIAHYAKVVKDKSLMRQLVKVANKVISDALEEEDEAEIVLDRAEQMIFALADERTRQGFIHIKQVAESMLEKAESMADRNTFLTGLTTGFNDLDAMTSGLQPSDLIIVAARPSMGKTALCLTLAQNAAIHAGAVVGIFSLEMSKESLVTRMLCSEGRVDSQRFRNGFLARDEWARLSHALGTLSEAKIFIDDTPGISVLEMRAKVRRLAAEQKRLDLIIVDYMQLMSGGARRTESRQQEVSQISRELKGLAKEMSTPLVALSQLSRAPEARTSHRPQLSDLRESGCIAGETVVTLADTGAQVAVRELIGRKDFTVWALNEKNFRIERAIVSRAFATGRKPVFLLKTRLGREIRATGNHKFRAFDGWRRLDELKIGERLALPRQIQCTGAQTINDAEAALLGHLIGDGCTLPRHVTQYTTRERELAETVSALSTEMFGDEIKPRINVERQWLQVYLTSTRRHTHGVHSPVTEWLTALGVYGLRSYEKRIPAQMFEQPQTTIAVFLRHLWATDGCIHLSINTAHYPAVYYATSSVELARGVQSLLLRFGINARLSRHTQSGKGRDQFHVNVTGRKNIELFLERIGTVGERRAASRDAILKYLSEHPARASRDVLPREAWRSEVVPAMSHIGITSRQMQAALGTSYCGSTLYASNLSRTRAALVAQIVDSDSLRALAESDVYWDEIASIEPDGATDVYDLTVPRHQNFIANDIVVHNSIEQDADLVAFIYREEQYNRSEENEGVAEIIIAKQRNGPTGDVKLAFLKEFTRFENMWRE